MPMRTHLQASLLALAAGLAAVVPGAIAQEAVGGAPEASADAVPPAEGGEETFLTAGELLALCRSAEQSAGEAQCLEFIFGLAQTVASMQQNDPSVQYFCIDPQVTAIQSVQRALVQGIEAQPQAAERPAFEVAIDVLGREWPCMSFDRL
jgi:hypothetical protein